MNDYHRKVYVFSTPLKILQKVFKHFFFRLIIGKPERKLKKGCGIHLDIVIICLINIICGIFGFPWLCGAAVRSIVHTSALTVMSRTHAPGEKPHLIEVKEQRLSALVVSIFIGKHMVICYVIHINF